MSRRLFFEWIARSAGLLCLGNQIYDNENVFSQKIEINLPAYRLTLKTYSGGYLKSKDDYLITIGKNQGKREATPVGEGYVDRKLVSPRFEY